MDNRRYWWYKLSASFSGILGVVVAVLAFVTSYTVDINKKKSAEMEIKKNYEMQAMLQKRISELESELKKTSSNIVNAKGNGVPQININRLETNLKEIQLRQDKIENIIMQNPAKALEMPLLRRDFEAIKENQATILVNVKQEIDRVYDINKWLLGAMAVSIITLAASNYLKGKD